MPPQKGAYTMVRSEDLALEHHWLPIRTLRGSQSSTELEVETEGDVIDATESVASVDLSEKESTAFRRLRDAMYSFKVRTAQRRHPRAERAARAGIRGSRSENLWTLSLWVVLTA